MQIVYSAIWHTWATISNYRAARTKEGILDIQVTHTVCRSALWLTWDPSGMHSFQVFNIVCVGAIYSGIVHCRKSRSYT